MIEALSRSEWSPREAAIDRFEKYPYRADNCDLIVARGGVIEGQLHTRA